MAFEHLKFSKKANMYELDYKLGSVVAKHDIKVQTVPSKRVQKPDTIILRELGPAMATHQVEQQSQ